jgi:hypothetical protein
MRGDRAELGDYRADLAQDANRSVDTKNWYIMER